MQRKVLQIIFAHSHPCVFNWGKTCWKEAGANVEVFGEYWDIADKEAICFSVLAIETYGAESLNEAIKVKYGDRTLLNKF